MADYEIQIKTSSFLAVQLARFQSIQLCPPPPLTIGDVALRIQRIEFGPNALRHDKPVDFPVFHKEGTETRGAYIPGFQTQIDQEVVLFACTEADLLAHPNGPPASELSIGVHAIFDLDYYALDPQCYFNMDLTDIRLGKLPAELSSAGVDLSAVEQLVKDRIKAAVPQVHSAINFANLVSAGEIQNAGISVSSDGAVLALRAEVGTSDGAGGINARWQNFLKGTFPNRLGTAEWGWLVPGNLLEEFVKATVWSHSGEGGVPVQGVHVLDVGSHYSGLGDRAHLDTTVRAEFGVKGVSETAEGTVGLDLTVPEPRHLRADIHLPSLEAIALTLGPVARFLVLVLAKPLLGASELFESMLGQVEVEVPGADCWQITPRHRACDMTLPSLESGETRLRLTAIDAQPGHLMLGGRVIAPHHTPSRLELEVRGFRWELPELSCEDADISYVAAVAELLPKYAPLRAEVALFSTGTTPAYLCSAEVIDDPLGVFPSSALRWDSWTLPTTIVLEVPNPGEEYNRHPYPLRIMVTTTLGTRLIEIPAAPELTPEVISQLTAAAVIAVGNCKLLMRPGFDLKWLIDPAPQETVLHRWDFAILGLLARDAVELSGVSGEPFVSVQAMAEMPTKLNAVVAAMGGERELSLQRFRNGDVGPTLSEMGIEIRQQPLEVLAALPLHSQCLRSFESTLWSPAGVVAVLDGGIAAFDLTRAEMPVKIGRWEMEGTLGAWSGAGGVIAYDERGFHRIDAERRIARIGPKREPARILDATAGDGFAYVLTERELELRSADDLMPRASSPADGAHCLLCHGSRLIVGRFGIDVYELDERGEIASSPVYSCPDFEFIELELARASGEEIVLARLADGTWRHLLIDAGGHGELIASFPQAPWFAGGTSPGERLLVLLGERRHSLLVTVPGKSHRVGAETMVDGGA